MQSRYYDPTLGRFLNADGYASTGQGILGNNMFAYCQNNPVNFNDSSGNMCVPCNPLRGGPAGLTSPDGIDDSFSPGSGDSLGKTIDKFFNNEDEQAIIDAEFYAFYKGVLYVKVPGNAAFSFGMVFFGEKVNETGLVRHEYGHICQLEEMGVLNYMSLVVLPSVTCYGLTEAGVLSAHNYYSYPWEYTADQLGGATHSYASWASTASTIYNVAVGFIKSMKGWFS